MERRLPAGCSGTIANEGQPHDRWCQAPSQLRQDRWCQAPSQLRQEPGDFNADERGFKTRSTRIESKDLVPGNPLIGSFSRTILDSLLD
jgi:hypothetical protein